MTILRILAFSLFTFSHFSYANSWQLGFHNDALSDKDGNYTGGFFINFTAPAVNWQNHLITNFPILKQADLSYAHSVHLGQKIWTPSDIAFAEPQQNERPYAGLSYAQFSALAFDNEQSYRSTLLFGIVGEKSKARSFQTEFHRMLDAKKPEGWHNQIENTLVYQLSLETDLLLLRTPLTDKSLDISTHLGLAGGNFQSDFTMGYTLRWGDHLASNFNSLNLRPYRLQGLLLPQKSRGKIFYLSTEFIYRANDITIDGDRPDNVPTTTLEKVQGNVIAGVFIFADDLGVNLSAIAFTPDFEEDLSHRYLIAAVSFYWRF